MSAGHGFCTLTGEPDGSKPLVVVLGWFGAQDRHVAKYCELLNREGYATVRATLPPAAVFAPIDWPRKRYAARLLDFLVATMPKLGLRKVVFYTFSNGGGFLLEQVDALVRREPRYAHVAAWVAGTAWDSAPCYMHLRVGASAIGEGRSPPVRLLLAVLFYLVVALMAVVAPRRPQTYWRHMQQTRLGARALYLYSEDDPLCDWRKLDELVAARRAALGGDAVAAVRWRRSQHVAHLRHHRREYMRALLGFLESV